VPPYGVKTAFRVPDLVLSYLSGTNVTLPEFKATGPIQSAWRAATCEQVTLQQVRLVRVLNRPMEYEWTPDSDATVEMVVWIKGTETEHVDPLRAEVSLLDLAALADQPNTELIKWVSKWGFLGFRPSYPLSHPRLITCIIPGRDRFFGPEHRILYGYEPLALIRESIHVAKAATDLYGALQTQAIHARTQKLKALIRPDDSTRVGNGIQMRVFGVDIGKHPPPRTPVEYDRLALRGLGVLTDWYLGSEFQLNWMDKRGSAREICLGWKVQSLLGALYLKLGYALRRSHCQACGAPISHLRRGAKTCGSACRRQLSRRNIKSSRS